MPIPHRPSDSTGKPFLALDGFDADIIDEAKKVILGSSIQFGFNEEGVLVAFDKNRVSHFEQAHSDYEKELLRHYEAKPFNLGVNALQVISAVIHMFTNYCEHIAADADAIKMTVYTVNDPRSLLGLYTQSEPFDPGDRLDRSGRSFDSFTTTEQEEILEYNKTKAIGLLEHLQENLQRLNILLNPPPQPKNQIPVIARDEYDEGDDDYWHPPPAEWHDPKLMLHACLSIARDLRIITRRVDQPDDYKYASNMCPDAVEFMERSKGASFLFYADGRHQELNDMGTIGYFMRQSWMQLAGNVLLQISPEILTNLQDELRKSPDSQITSSVYPKP